MVGVAADARWALVLTRRGWATPRRLRSVDVAQVNTKERDVEARGSLKRPRNRHSKILNEDQAYVDGKVV